MSFAQLTLTIMLTAATTVTTLGANNLQWKSHYGTAKRSAQATQRPLVVVIEHSHEQDQIDDGSLGNDSREILASKDFELVKVDANTDYGKRVALAFGAREFPYTAVTDDASKRIVFRKSGQMSESDWTLALAKSIKTETTLEPQPAKQVSEVVVVQKPVVVQPASSYTVTSTNNTTPQPIYQSPIPIQSFAPSGFYQLPASQCVT